MNAVDEILRKLPPKLDCLESIDAGSVKFRKYDVEILELLKSLTPILLSSLKNSDRSALLEAFGGDCARIARVHAVLVRVQLHSAGGAAYRIAERRAAVETCLAACLSIERVLGDLGLGIVLCKAKEADAGLHDGPDCKTREVKAPSERRKSKSVFFELVATCDEDAFCYIENSSSSADSAQGEGPSAEAKSEMGAETSPELEVRSSPAEVGSPSIQHSSGPKELAVVEASRCKVASPDSAETGSPSSDVTSEGEERIGADTSSDNEGSTASPESGELSVQLTPELERGTKSAESGLSSRAAMSRFIPVDEAAFALVANTSLEVGQECVRELHTCRPCERVMPTQLTQPCPCKTCSQARRQGCLDKLRAEAIQHAGRRYEAYPNNKVSMKLNGNDIKAHSGHCNLTTDVLELVHAEQKKFEATRGGGLLLHRGGLAQAYGGYR